MVIEHNSELKKTEAAHFDHVHGGEVFNVCDAENVWLYGEALRGGGEREG